eukprot:scaffold3234_cov105-Isochrysis_galbana.AAC.2
MLEAVRGARCRQQAGAPRLHPLHNPSGHLVGRVRRCRPPTATGDHQLRHRMRKVALHACACRSHRRVGGCTSLIAVGLARPVDGVAQAAIGRLDRSVHSDGGGGIRDVIGLGSGGGPHRVCEDGSAELAPSGPCHRRGCHTLGTSLPIVGGGGVRCTRVGRRRGLCSVGHIKGRGVRGGRVGDGTTVARLSCPSWPHLQQRLARPISPRAGEGLRCANCLHLNKRVDRRSRGPARPHGRVPGSIPSRRPPLRRPHLCRPLPCRQSEIHPRGAEAGGGGGTPATCAGVCLARSNPTACAGVCPSSGAGGCDGCACWRCQPRALRARPWDVRRLSTCRARTGRLTSRPRLRRPAPRFHRVAGRRCPATTGGQVPYHPFFRCHRPAIKRLRHAGRFKALREQIRSMNRFAADALGVVVALGRHLAFAAQAEPRCELAYQHRHIWEARAPEVREGLGLARQQPAGRRGEVGVVMPRVADETEQRTARRPVVPTPARALDQERGGKAAVPRLPPEAQRTSLEPTDRRRNLFPGHDAQSRVALLFRCRNLRHCRARTRLDRSLTPYPVRRSHTRHIHSGSGGAPARRRPVPPPRGRVRPARPAVIPDPAPAAVIPDPAIPGRAAALRQPHARVNRLLVIPCVPRLLVRRTRPLQARRWLVRRQHLDRIRHVQQQPQPAGGRPEERVPLHLRSRRTVGRVWGEHGPHERVEVADTSAGHRQAGARPRQAERRPGAPGDVQLHLERPTGEGVRAAQRRMDQAPQGEDVRWPGIAGVRSLAAGMAARAERAGLAARPAATHLVALDGQKRPKHLWRAPAPGAEAEGGGEAKVGQLGSPGRRQQHVGRLDVAVRQAVLVKVAQPAYCLCNQRQAFGGGTGGRRRDGGRTAAARGGRIPGQRRKGATSRLASRPFRDGHGCNGANGPGRHPGGCPPCVSQLHPLRQRHDGGLQRQVDKRPLRLVQKEPEHVRVRVALDQRAHLAPG